MARKKMTPRDFFAKVEWEGGIDSSLEYGLRSGDMDDSDPKLKEAWATLERLFLDKEGKRARLLIEKRLEDLDREEPEDGY